MRVCACMRVCVCECVCVELFLFPHRFSVNCTFIHLFRLKLSYKIISQDDGPLWLYDKINTMKWDLTMNIILRDI